MSPSSAWTAGCLSLGSPRVSVMGHGGGMISQFALCMLLKEHDDKLALPPKDLGARRMSRVTAYMSNLVRSCERLQALVQDDTSVRRSLINHVRLLVRDTQNRLAESVAILKDYAELYSADLSDEIKSRAAAHHQLDNRLQRASTLRCAVVDLGDSFELNVLQPWKGVRAAVLACPLTEETALLDELRHYIDIIEVSYADLKAYWRKELRATARCLHAPAYVDSRAADNWGSVVTELQAVHDVYTVDLPPPPSTPPPQSHGVPACHVQLPLPTFHPTPRTPLARISGNLLHALCKLKRALVHARALTRPGFSALNAEHLDDMNTALASVEQHVSDALDILRQSIAYAEGATAETRDGPRFVRVAAAGALRARAAALVKAPKFTDRIAMVPDAPAAVRKVRRALRDVKTRLFASERMWCALVAPGEQDVFATLLRGGEAAAADACTVEQLRYVLCAVSREGKTLGALTLP